MPPAVFGSIAQQRDFPVELTSEEALLGYLDVSAVELKKIWWFRHRMYHIFNLGKPSGKPRVISAPNARLKYLQRRIAPLLERLYRVRKPVHGFVAGKSVKTNAEAHLRKRHIVNLDLKDFFASITEARIAGVLRSLGVDSRVSAIIARLSTNHGQLPQGAPTSPILSNMICFGLDRV